MVHVIGPVSSHFNQLLQVMLIEIGLDSRLSRSGHVHGDDRLAVAVARHAQEVERRFPAPFCRSRNVRQPQA